MTPTIPAGFGLDTTLRRYTQLKAEALARKLAA